MISHLFYHQETVEPECAHNSWNSIRDWFSDQDEVVILDLGFTLKNEFGLSIKPKFFSVEHIRTDIPEERSYTFGLNRIIPELSGEWVILWRSDYIYSKKYFSSLLSGIKEGNTVVPYEAFIGAPYCTPSWCQRNLDLIVNGNEETLLLHSTVCPVYEFMDFPHFAIKKELWLKSGGMDSRLWGYGWQFPELFLRLKNMPEYTPSIQFDMKSFHQTHRGSFGMGILTEAQQEERRQSEQKLLKVFGSAQALGKFKNDIVQPPLRPRRQTKFYELKTNDIEESHNSQLYDSSKYDSLMAIKSGLLGSMANKY